MKSNIMKQLGDAGKSMRMWPTWKLKTTNIGLNSETYSAWDRMSNYERQFNLAWNELFGLCRDVSLLKLKKILEYAKTLK